MALFGGAGIIVVLGVTRGIMLAYRLVRPLLMVGGSTIMIEHVHLYAAVLGLRIAAMSASSGVAVQSIRFVHERRLLHVVIREGGKSLNYTIKVVKNASDAVTARFHQGVEIVGRAQGYNHAHPGQGFAVTVKGLNGAPVDSRAVQMFQRAVEQVSASASSHAGVTNRVLQQAESLAGRGSLPSQSFNIPVR